jgi:hypothetical protein
MKIECLKLGNTVTEWAVSRKLIGKYVPTNAHPLLGNRLVNISSSNEYVTIGCPLIGNACVAKPDNNTGYPLPRN